MEAILGVGIDRRLYRIWYLGHSICSGMVGWPIIYEGPSKGEKMSGEKAEWWVWVLVALGVMIGVWATPYIMEWLVKL